MSFRIDLWSANDNKLNPLQEVALDSEDRLEGWLANDISLLGVNLLIIGRQVITDHGGRIDLLAIDQDANCVVIELKRHRTPRDVVAQLLDYASWVQELTYDNLDAICFNYNNEKLADAFSKFAGGPLPESVNSQHSLYLVASHLDDSSERIIRYLANTHALDINAVFFTCFKNGGGEIVGRAWLQDPVEVSERSVPSKRTPWEGYWFVNVGENEHRNWDDCRKYKFVGAGQGPQYSNELKKMKPGDRFFAYMRGIGYTGYGEVVDVAVPVDEFVPEGENRKYLDCELRATQADSNINDREYCEWAVPVRWIKTVERDSALNYKGIFANQHIVCKLRNQNTLDYLKREFNVRDN